MGTPAQCCFIFVLSLLDSLDVLFARYLINTDGPYCQMETEYLYRDGRALSAESDWHGRIVCAAFGIAFLISEAGILLVIRCSRLTREELVMQLEIEKVDVINISSL